MFKEVKKNPPLCWEWEAKGKYILDDAKNMGTPHGQRAQYCAIILVES
jgi:hypothetical protein